MPVEKSGVHLTGGDSGWPVGDVAAEPPHTKDGTGTDVAGHDAMSVAGGAVQDASSVDEVQTITQTSVTGGTFTLALTYDGAEHETAPIAAGAALSAAAVQSAIEALDGVEGGDVTVTGAAGGPFTVAFGGRFADQDVPAIAVDDAGVTGAGADVAVATTTPGVD